MITKMILQRRLLVVPHNSWSSSSLMKCRSSSSLSSPASASLPLSSFILRKAPAVADVASNTWLFRCCRVPDPFQQQQQQRQQQPNVFLSQQQHRRWQSSSTTSNKDVTGKQQEKEIDESESQEKRVLISMDDEYCICHVQLNRPTKMNALDMKMFYAIDETIQHIRQRATTLGGDIRVVILSGNGRSFCSGLDVNSVVLTKDVLKNMNALLERKQQGTPHDESTIQDYSSVCNLAQRICLGWRDVPVPVLASIHGACFGGGLQLALGADVRFASAAANTRLSIMETKWGLIPDMGASVTLPQACVSLDHVNDLTFTGRVISAQEAARIGLVTQLVETSSGSSESDDTELQASSRTLEHVFDYARQLTKRSPDALSRAKRLYQTAYSGRRPSHPFSVQQSGGDDDDDLDSNMEDDDQLEENRRLMMSEVVKCLELETALQRELLLSWNQFASSARSLTGWKVPYKNTRPTKVK